MADTSRIASLQAAQIMIEELDTNIFGLGTSSPGDRRSMLWIQNIVRIVNESYVYIEIGSDMGGSLAPYLLDRKCRLVISVDKRPDSQVDERGCSFDYSAVNTGRMIENLEQHLPFASLLKLVTHDIDATDLPADTVRFDLAFIDGEHTNRAAFQDFVSLYRFAKGDCIVMWHDANLVTDAIANVEAFLRYENKKFETLVLPDVICAMFIGNYVDRASPLRRFAIDKEKYFSHAKEELWKGIARSRANAAK